jgi:hypothetical protein
MSGRFAGLKVSIDYRKFLKAKNRALVASSSAQK